MAVRKKLVGKRDREISEALADTFPASDPASIAQSAGGVTGSEVVDAAEQRLNKIRERAYSIWLDEGQCHGRDHAHWKQAESEIDGEGGGSALFSIKDAP